MRKHKYQFMESWPGLSGPMVKINHSAYGPQVWILRETWRERVCHGTGRPIKREEKCWSLSDYHNSANRKHRLSVEFVKELESNPDKWM